MTESPRVYDLDGTLVRLQVDWRAAEADVRAVISRADIDVDPEKHGVWSLFDVADEHGLTAVVEERVAPHEIDGAKEAVRLPAADELEAMDRPAAVCSLNCEAACRIALERHGLMEHVAAVVGRDTVAHRKPHPEPLLAAVDSLSARPEETLFVGDSESDAECAERAGTRFAFVGERVGR